MKSQPYTKQNKKKTNINKNREKKMKMNNFRFFNNI